MSKSYRSRLSLLACAATLVLGIVTLQPANAATRPISGSATGTIGALGVPVPLPASAAFTGTHDNVSGALKATLTSDPFSLSLPLSGDTLAVTAAFANPGGFTGNASGTTATLDGSIKLTLTELDVPGFDLPIPIALLNCSLTFPLHLSGTWNETTGIVDVSQSEVAVPALPVLCALGIQTATQVDINSLLAQLPAGSVSLRLAIDGPPATTTTTTSTSPSTTSTTIAPATTMAPATTIAPATTTTMTPTSTSPSTTSAPTSTVPFASSTTSPSVGPNTQAPTTTLRLAVSPSATQQAAPAAHAVAATPNYVG